LLFANLPLNKIIHNTAFPMIVTDIYFDENNELYAVGKSAEQNKIQQDNLDKYYVLS